MNRAIRRAGRNHSEVTGPVAHQGKPRPFHVHDNFLAVRLDPWKKSLRKRMASHPRYYLLDTGVTNAVNRRLAAPVDPVMRGW